MQENNKEQTLMIGVEEAAKLMGIGRNMMLDLVKLDNFPAVRLGKRKGTIKINRQQFIEWVNSLTRAN